MIANTGDDVEIHGAHVSPDPDLVAFWLADRIDARGWGLDGRHVPAMDAPARLRRGGLVQPRRRDLEIGRDRARRLAAGERLTRGARRAARRRWVSRCRVLPMADDPVRTFVTTGSGLPFQEWMIRAGGKRRRARRRSATSSSAAPRRAVVAPEVAEAIARARAIVIGPGEPRHLDRPDPRRARDARGARRARAAPVVAVSPLVGGRGAQGPDRGVPARGRASAARRRASPRPTTGLLDGLVADEPCDALPACAPTSTCSTPRGRAAAWRARRCAFAAARDWIAPMSAPSPARPCSSPAPAAASASPSRCARRATAPTSPHRQDRRAAPQARGHGPHRRGGRSRRPAARRCRSSATSATRTPSPAPSPQTVERFGGIDVCVNNASAINLSPARAADMKRYDLMQDINTRGTFLVSKACLPHLLEAENPHVLTLSPPLNLDPRWFARPRRATRSPSTA